MQDPYIEFYKSLATLTDSGSTMTESLNILAASQPNNISQGLQRAITALDQGEGLKQALEQANVFTPWEVRMLVAGERSGHLPEICHRLGNIREQKNRYVTSFLSKIAYPLLVVHLAILGPSLYVLVQSGLPAYLNTIIPFLLILYIIIAIPLVTYQISRLSNSFAKTWDIITLHIPLVGTCILQYQLSNATHLLCAFYSAGITIRDATEELSQTTPNIVLREMFFRIYNRLQAGEPLEEAIKYEKWLPPYLKNMLVTGNKAGKLEEHLERGQKYLEQQAETSITRLIAIVSTTIFLFAAIFVAYKVISFYSNYVNQMLQMLPNHQK